MQVAIFIYILTMMLLWQIAGNFASTNQRPPEEVSLAEANLWGKNNAFTLIGLILAKGMWIFALAYPIYWAITQSIVQAIILFMAGNVAAIIFTSFLKKIFGIPEVTLAYIGIVICPLLMIGIWFVRV